MSLGAIVAIGLVVFGALAILSDIRDSSRPWLRTIGILFALLIGSVIYYARTGSFF